MKISNIRINNIDLNLVHQGCGPLVIMVHGFPGLAYSFRYQLDFLATQGFTAVALDTRGYGRSERPEKLADYSINKQLEDLCALLEYFGEEKAVFIGHDFGANLVWQMAARFPEKVAGVVSLAVPYGMDLAGGADIKPSDMFASIAEHHFFHMHYFQQVGPAEAELGENPKAFLTKLFWALSGEGNLLNWENYPSESTGYMDVLEDAPPMPWHWIDDNTIDHYVTEYCYGCENTPEKIFIGGLNAYRVMDINWEQGKAYANADINVPALFIAGSEDPVIKLAADTAIETMRQRIPDLRGAYLIEGAGHFVQQEAPEQVNHYLLHFLTSLKLKVKG